MAISRSSARCADDRQSVAIIVPPEPALEFGGRETVHRMDETARRVVVDMTLRPPVTLKPSMGAMMGPDGVGDGTMGEAEPGPTYFASLDAPTPYRGIAPGAFARSACQHARACGADRLHPSMRSRIWQPGVSGNPTGRGGLYLECRRLAAEASPEAMRRLIELMEAEDERVSYMATVAVLDRSGVKPIDYDPAQDVTPPTWDPGALTPEERENLKGYLAKMVRKGKP